MPVEHVMNTLGADQHKCAYIKNGSLASIVCLEIPVSFPDLLIIEFS